VKDHSGDPLVSARFHKLLLRAKTGLRKLRYPVTGLTRQRDVPYWRREGLYKGAAAVGDIGAASPKTGVAVDSIGRIRPTSRRPLAAENIGEEVTHRHLSKRQAGWKYWHKEEQCVDLRRLERQTKTLVQVGAPRITSNSRRELSPDGLVG
jgi:hypothetical protein